MTRAGMAPPLRGSGPFPWGLAALAGLLLAGCASGGGSAPGAAGTALLRVDPAILMGRSPQEVAARLGEPELKRREPPAEIWQYRTRDCVLDVYLFAESGALRVVHTEARRRSDGQAAAGGCQGALAAR